MNMKKVAVALLFTGLFHQAAHAADNPKGADLKVSWEQVREFTLKSKPLDIAHSLDGKYAFVLTEHNSIQVYDAKGNLQGTIPVAEGVNAIALDPLGQYLYLSNSSTKSFATLAIDFVLQIETSSAPSKGKDDAPITIAVFSDFQ